MAQPQSVTDFTPEVMNAMGDLIKSVCPDRVGFALVFFDFGDGLREMKYVSNAQRSDMKATFQALAQKWEAEERGF